jgi:hypothetical protein
MEQPSIIDYLTRRQERAWRGVRRAGEYLTAHLQTCAMCNKTPFAGDSACSTQSELDAKCSQAYGGYLEAVRSRNRARARGYR